MCQVTRMYSKSHFYYKTIFVILWLIDFVYFLFLVLLYPLLDSFLWAIISYFLGFCFMLFLLRVLWSHHIQKFDGLFIIYNLPCQMTTSVEEARVESMSVLCGCLVWDDACVSCVSSPFLCSKGGSKSSWELAPSMLSGYQHHQVWSISQDEARSVTP
jgi:hypothetical protein